MTRNDLYVASNRYGERVGSHKLTKKLRHAAKWRRKHGGEKTDKNKG